MEDRYIGPRKVAVVSEEDFKTPLNGDVVKVTFEDGQFRIMPKKAFELFVTDKPIDYTAYADRQHEAVRDEVLKLMMEFDLSPDLVPTFLQAIAYKILNIFDKATYYMWKGEVASWTPGSNYREYMSFMEAEKILKDVPATESKKQGAESDQ